MQYPTVDMLCRKAAQLGAGIKGYKIDMDRAFKQIFMDFADWPLLGIMWNQTVYFDKTAVMGSRSAPYICQRVMNFIRHVMVNLKYYVANYVDDFMGLDYPDRIWASFTTLRNLLRDLGVSEAVQKAVLPADVVEFLGVLYDLVNLMITVTPQRRQELEQELQGWQNKTRFSRKQLQSLLGKLQFISNCVRQGRLLVFRLRNALRDMDREWQCITEDMLKDIQCWMKFLPVYNTASIMWMDQCMAVDQELATDACLTGIGALAWEEYCHAKIPAELVEDEDWCIAHYELLAILVSLRVWKTKFKGKRFLVQCDNKAVVDVINCGTARDRNLQKLLRCFAYE